MVNAGQGVAGVGGVDTDRGHSKTAGVDIGTVGSAGWGRADGEGTREGVMHGRFVNALPVKQWRALHSATKGIHSSTRTSGSILAMTCSQKVLRELLGSVNGQDDATDTVELKARQMVLHWSRDKTSLSDVLA